jgi:diguanylate cyclase (GGDEF)-like protein
MIYPQQITPDELLATQLELVMRNGRGLTLCSQLIGVAATLLLFWFYVPGPLLGLWAGAVVLLVVVHTFMVNRALSGHRYRDHPRARVWQLVIGAALLGVAWSAAYIFVADRAPASLQHLFLVLIFMITLVSVGVTVIIREYFVAFLFTSLWPIAWWSVAHYWEQPHNLLTGLGLLAVCALLVSLCERGYQFYRTSIAANWEKEWMSRELGKLTTSLMDRNRELQKMREQLTDLANVDELTGLGNRRLVNRVLNDEVSRAVRTGTDLSVILLDVDCFKRFNDSYGHPAGDRVLARLGALIQEVVARAGEVAARYGGEEFILILPGTDAAAAAQTAARLRDLILAEAIPHRESSVADCVTISQGVITMEGGAVMDAEALVSAADAALYRAKDAGRNTVVAARERSSAPVQAIPASLRKSL